MFGNKSINKEGGLYSHGSKSRAPGRACPAKKTAFTLIELLVVIAIIAVLAAILLPSLRSMRDRGRQITCLSNLKQLGFGLQMYLADYKGWFIKWRDNSDPAVDFFGNWVNAMAYYASGQIKQNRYTIMSCPSTALGREPDAQYEGGWGTYDSNPQLITSDYTPPVHIGSVKDPSRCAFAADTYSFGGAGLYLGRNGDPPSEGNYLGRVHSGTRNLAKENPGNWYNIPFSATSSPEFGRGNVLFVDGHVESRINVKNTELTRSGNESD